MTRRPHHFLTFADVPAAEWPAVLDRAARLKADRGEIRHDTLAG